MKNWLIVVGKSAKIYLFAAKTISNTVKKYYNCFLPIKSFDDIGKEELSRQNIIFIGNPVGVSKDDITGLLVRGGYVDIPKKKESYSVYVGENLFNKEKQMVAVTGYDDIGVLYGCMDFCNRYCGKELVTVEDHNELFDENFFDGLFDNPLKKWKVSESPAIPTRAIWTWGHVIYDYCRFFENMARIRLNEIVIWNDYVPKNAREVVECAHSLGIKVIWGFAWGWGLNCADEIQKLSAEGLNKLKESILSVYEKQYSDTGADGIYFQSFTELHTDNVGGKCIAEVVTGFVNDVAGELLKRYPTLNIQFGLHATSVKTHLNYLTQLDERVRIVWEDCGAFPYAYMGDQVENFDVTREFTKELMCLRGESECFGAVLKGMTNLDWHNFKHATESIVIGKKSKEFIEKRQKKKNRLWKIVQANWIKNAEYARLLVSDISKNGKDPVLQGLIEDGMLEIEIPYSVALFADILWEPNRNIDEIKENVAKYPCVQFANV